MHRWRTGSGPGAAGCFITKLYAYIFPNPGGEAVHKRTFARFHSDASAHSLARRRDIADGRPHAGQCAFVKGAC